MHYENLYWTWTCACVLLHRAVDVCVSFSAYLIFYHFRIPCAASESHLSNHILPGGKFLMSCNPTPVWFDTKYVHSTSSSEAMCISSYWSWSIWGMHSHKCPKLSCWLFFTKLCQNTKSMDMRKISQDGLTKRIWWRKFFVFPSWRRDTTI